MRRRAVAIYDGWVTTDEGEVHVILGIDEDRLTMSSNGNAIGEWSAEEVDVDHIGDDVYRIRAEEESLRFVPNEPSLFGSAFKESHTDPEDQPVVSREPVPATGVEPVESNSRAKPLTLGLFYALAAITAALGLWALVSIVIG